MWISAQCLWESTSEFQQRPCAIIDRGEYHAMTEQLITRLQHIRHIHIRDRRYVLNVQPLIVLRTALQRLIYPLRIHADIRHLPPIRHSARTTIASLILRATACAVLLLDGAQIAFGEVEVDVCGFEEVILDFHLIGYRPYDMSADMTFVVECLQAAPDTSPLVLDELWFGRGCAIDIHGRGSIGIDPLLDFYGACAVVKLVGYVCGLGGYVANLTHERYLSNLDFIDTEVCVWVRLASFEDLLYCDWSECVFSVCSLQARISIGCAARVLVRTADLACACTLTSTLGTSHEASATGPTLSSIGSSRVASSVI